MIRTLSIISLLAGLIAATPVWAAEEEEGAEEEAAVTAPSANAEQKTLAERIPSVTRRVFAKKGRLELAPALGWSLNDPFYNNLVISARGAYHVTEWLWVEAAGDFYGSFTNAVPVTGGGNPSAPSYNHPKFSAGLDLGFAPLYGKFSLLAERVVHFDTYVALGGGVVGPATGSAVLAGTLAVGQHYFVNEWLALRLELKDETYKMSRAPKVATATQNMLSFSLGLSFFVPPTFQHEVL